MATDLDVGAGAVRDVPGAMALLTTLAGSGLLNDEELTPDEGSRDERRERKAGQGIALNDRLIKQEIEEGKLVRLSEVELSSYGYFLARPSSGPNAHSVEEFVQWLKDTQTGFAAERSRLKQKNV